MTILSMALEPELFRVGVAIAPVTEWTGYDTAYTERYLGRPAAEPEAYERSSVMGMAGAVHGDLLLIHGTSDENVHLRHSMRLVEAFRSTGRELALIELSEQRHTTRGPSVGVRDGHAVAHLLGGLGLPPPDELA
jgi:dipeptidyl-peptidase-4